MHWPINSMLSNSLKKISKDAHKDICTKIFVQGLITASTITLKCQQHCKYSMGKCWNLFWLWYIPGWNIVQLFCKLHFQITEWYSALLIMYYILKSIWPNFNLKRDTHTYICYKYRQTDTCIRLYTVKKNVIKYTKMLPMITVSWR